MQAIPAETEKNHKSDGCGGLPASVSASGRSRPSATHSCGDTGSLGRMEVPPRPPENQNEEAKNPEML